MEIALFFLIISSNNIGKINFIQTFEETILYFLGLEALCIGRKHNYARGEMGHPGTPCPISPQIIFL